MKNLHAQIEPKDSPQQLIDKGITISRTPGIDPFYSPESDSSRGRPRSNILTAYQVQKGGGKVENINLGMKRVEILAKHKMWKKSPQHRNNAKSFKYKDQRKPIWTVHFAAELAMILTGRHIPEDIFDRPKYLQEQGAFSEEVYFLWRFMNEMVSNAKSLQRQSGPTPNPEKLFKTALAAYVAKKLKQPNGGNHTVVPTPLQISQTWFLIFGEFMSKDSIKNLLPTTAQYCTAFPKYTRVPGQKFGSLGKALGKKYGSNKHRL